MNTFVTLDQVKQLIDVTVKPLKMEISMLKRENETLKKIVRTNMTNSDKLKQMEKMYEARFKKMQQEINTIKFDIAHRQAILRADFKAANIHGNERQRLLKKKDAISAFAHNYGRDPRNKTSEAYVRAKKYAERQNGNSGSLLSGKTQNAKNHVKLVDDIQGTELRPEMKNTPSRSLTPSSNARYSGESRGQRSQKRKR